MAYDFSEEREATNKELAEEIATRTTLTSAQIQKLLPKKQDKQRLKELIGIVNSAASDNAKAAALRKNFAALGGTVLRILKTVV